MVDMTLCKNVNCESRMQCYRYLEGLRCQEDFQSYFLWQDHKEKCDSFIDINIRGKEWWGL